MLTTKLDTHIVNPKKEAVGTVIWMHGLGADCHDFDTLIPHLTHNGNIPLRFVFPNAPVRPITINHDMPTRAWYDVYSLTDLNREDQEGINASQFAITRLIQQEIEKGIPAHRILIAGFSQGGAIALYTGVRQTQALAGILVLSSYLPLMQQHPENAHPANIHTPIFIAHGTHDMTLPCLAGKMAYDTVRQTHPNAQWREYPMGHEIAHEVTQDVSAFLAKVFA